MHYFLPLINTTASILFDFLLRVFAPSNSSCCSQPAPLPSMMRLTPGPSGSQGGLPRHLCQPRPTPHLELHAIHCILYLSSPYHHKKGYLMYLILHNKLTMLTIHFILFRAQKLTFCWFWKFNTCLLTKHMTDFLKTFKTDQDFACLSFFAELRDSPD